MNSREPTRWELFRWGLLDFWQRVRGAWDVLHGRAEAVYPVEVDWPLPSLN